MVVVKRRLKMGKMRERQKKNGIVGGDANREMGLQHISGGWWL